MCRPTIPTVSVFEAINKISLGSFIENGPPPPGLGSCDKCTKGRSTRESVVIG